MASPPHPLRPFIDVELHSLPRIIMIMTRDDQWSPQTYDPPDPVYLCPSLSRLRHVNVTSVVTSDTRRLRYNCIDRSDVNAENHIGLNIYEQEVLRVIDYEHNIPRIIKWNGSEISKYLVENTDAAGYRKAESTVFPHHELEQRNTILLLKHSRHPHLTVSTRIDVALS